ncbi:MAG: restriction endonuclease [Acidobacteria bacterium]|nr:MAG: restriction endonuclease [Acidobacteriota bacterium]
MGAAAMLIVSKPMLINEKAWKIKLHFDKLKTAYCSIEGNAIISAAEMKTRICSFLKKANVPRDYIDSTFGFLNGECAFKAMLSLSNLLQERDVSTENIRRSQTSLATSGLEQSNLIREKILRDVHFTGYVLLENGGLYPSVVTQQLLLAAFDAINFGYGVTKGLGKVKSCKMQREDTICENAKLDRVEIILRECGDKLIRQIVIETQSLNKIEWRDLERIVAQIYEELGFKVILTEASKDGAKDIILFCLSSDRIGGLFSAKKYYVELKHWRSGKAVNSKFVRKALEVSTRDGVNGLTLFSTSGFASNISLEGIDRKKLKLQDIRAIRKLCRFYVESKRGDLYMTRTLEEIFNLDLS